MYKNIIKSLSFKNKSEETLYKELTPYKEFVYIERFSLMPSVHVSRFLFLSIKILYGFLFILSFLSVFMFVSCSEQKENTLIDNTSIFDKLSSNACYYLTENSEYKKFDGNYFPEKLKTLLERRSFIDGTNLTFFEMMNPEYTGIVDCENVYTGCDDALWVDKAIFEINEDLMAMMLEELENNPQPAIDETSTAEEIQRAIEDSEKIEKRIIDASNILRFLEFDQELFIPVTTTQNKVFIEKNEKELSRIFYDDYYRISKKEFWNISNLENSRIIRTETYEYSDGSLNPSRKTIISDEEKQIYFYDRQGLVTRNETFVIYEEKAYIKSISVWKYDDEKRVKEEVVRTNSYRDKNYLKIQSKNTTRTKYFYNNVDSIPPDFEYYVNNELKMKNTYSDVAGTYTSHIFFDKTFAVKTYYENNLRKRDVYTANGIVKRVEKYE